MLVELCRKYLIICNVNFNFSKDSSVLVPEDVVKTKAKEMCDEQLLDLEDEDTTLCMS